MDEEIRTIDKIYLEVMEVLRSIVAIVRLTNIRLYMIITYLLL